MALSRKPKSERPKSERERLMVEIRQAQAQLRDAETELRRVQQREPFVQRLADGINDRRVDNHFGRDFEITLTPRRSHA